MIILTLTTIGQFLCYQTLIEFLRKLIFNRMESFIEKNNLSSPFQYGFRKAHQLFRGIINKWFSPYLEDRTQTTQIGSFIYPEKKITFGVP